jgi:hypothetical protein
MSSECKHTITQGRESERGSWCCACGVKVYDVDQRECNDCAHHKRLLTGSICSRHLMAVVPTMNVTFKIAEGTCWTSAHNPGSSGQPDSAVGGSR